MNILLCIFVAFAAANVYDCVKPLTDKQKIEMGIELRTIIPRNDLPDTFDAREHWPECAEVIGYMRDQGPCGSCWAFGSVEAMNDRWCIHTGEKVILSAEDRTTNDHSSMGCNGGFHHWSWFISPGTVTGGNYGDTDGCQAYYFPKCAHHEKSPHYPDCKGTQRTPPASKNCDKGSNATYSQDKRQIKKAYSLSGEKSIMTDIYENGPVSASFTVYGDFPTYKSGVYEHQSGSMLGRHAIKILGWGEEDGKNYWLVQNSWNEDWGDKGYFKILRGSDHCGIENDIAGGDIN